jgi:hypothetical protein
MREIFIPTKRTEYFFVAIFIVVLLWSLMTFPIASFMGGNIDEASFKIGWPKAFFELTMSNPDEMPFNITWLIIDIIIYFLISYILDVIIALFLIWIGTSFKSSSPDTEVYTKAKAAYNYYKNKGLEEKQIIEMFKQRGWKEEDIMKIAKGN